MVGLVSLQQGPLGVAASVRRAVPKPGTEGIAQPGEPDGTTLDRPASERTAHNPVAGRKEKQNQEPIESVAPSTLFEASRIATTLALPEFSPAPPSPGRMEPWIPPGSTLALRDRSV